MNPYDSIIGDIRRIGTAHNIQLVCGVNLIQIHSAKCQSLLILLLRSSSKTAQRDLLYALQIAIQTNRSDRRKRQQTVFIIARLLGQTYRPSRWLIENILHEIYHNHQINSLPIESSLLQALTLIAQNERLPKLKEMLCNYLVRRFTKIFSSMKFSSDNIANDSIEAFDRNRSDLNTSDDNEDLDDGINELFLFDSLKMLTNLDNFTAIQSVHNQIGESIFRRNRSTILTIATIHSYRRSINRSLVQTILGELFQMGSCQIQQEVVQLLIDNIDLINLEQTIDKRWPKYSFNQLDQDLAENLL